MKILLEENHDLPLVDIQWTFRLGAVYDPAGKEGLTRLLARVIRMGTSRMRQADVEERMTALGAQLSIDIGMSAVRFSGTVIARNLRPFVELIAELLNKPSLREEDMAQAIRETKADLISLLDNDRALCDRFFRKALFMHHPYARPIMGTQESLDAIRRDDLINHHKVHYVSDNMIIGVAGDFESENVETLLEETFSQLGGGAARPSSMSSPLLTVEDSFVAPQVVLVNKPERTQTQILVGTLGTHLHDPAFTPLIVGNTAFGGTFTSRLTREVRAKRGWSYGASSRISADRGREVWSMFTFPAAKDAVDCLELQLKLYKEWWQKGITQDELKFSRENLSQSYAFEIDTAAKRLEQKVDIELYDLPSDYYSGYVKRVKAVTQAQAKRAVQMRLARDALVMVMVATEATVAAPLSKLANRHRAHMNIVQFDAL